MVSQTTMLESLGLVLRKSFIGSDKVVYRLEGDEMLMRRKEWIEIVQNFNYQFFGYITHKL